jgi:hypothetical protein
MLFRRVFLGLGGFLSLGHFLSLLLFFWSFNLFLFRLLIWYQILQVISLRYFLLMLEGIKLEQDLALDFLLIEQQIGTLIFPPPVLTTKALALNILRIELLDPLIIELEPLGIALNKAEVVAILSRTNMHDYSLELVFEVVGVGHAVLFLGCVVVHVQLVRELPARVYFLVGECVVVEADALEVDDQVVRHSR